MSRAGKRLRGLKGAEWTEASLLSTRWAEPPGGRDTGPGQAWGSEGHPWAEAQTCGLSLWRGEAGSRTHQGLISQQLGGHPSTAHSDRTAGCGLCYTPSPYLLTDREQVHHSNARARREFISSALGPKSHPAQWNPTRAPNKGVWRLIYRQLFVSVTGVAGVT